MVLNSRSETWMVFQEMLGNLMRNRLLISYELDENDDIHLVIRPPKKEERRADPRPSIVTPPPRYGEAPFFSHNPFGEPGSVSDSTKPPGPPQDLINVPPEVADPKF